MARITIFKKTSCTALYLIILFSLIAGCATNQRPRARQAYSANQYLQMAEGAQGNEKQGYLLQATNRLIDEKQRMRARILYKQLAEDLPPNLKTKKQLILAKLLLSYRQNAKALNTLQMMNNDHAPWTRKDKIEWHTLAAKANENLGNINASIKERSDIVSLLPNKEKKSNLLLIWNTLENTSTTRIRELLSQATTPTVKGWLTLAAITDQSNISAQTLAEQLRRWKIEYSNHPATILLPSSTKQLKNISEKHPQHIALLLPLTGRYSKAGNAIRKGFFAAYYNAKKQGQPTPEITIINTADQNITSAYQAALSKGVNFVVGPLTKNNVATLAKTTRISVPTLALNTATHINNKNLYQFGLSPLDEARQAAVKAWDSHRHSALVIAPKNNWGKTIAETFEKTWQSLGGQVAGALMYTNQRNFSSEIRRLLNIDLATKNKIALKQLLHQRIRYIPRRRKDTDIIFLIATPPTARQIRPLLRYYYAGNIPVYAISSIYSGQPNVHRDHDLNGIRFPDMPWVLSASMKPNSLNVIRQQARQTWPQSYTAHAKLIALGVDAYDIIFKLNRMAMLPDLGTPAATGTLYLDKKHHVYRKLRWSKIRNGIPYHFK